MIKLRYKMINNNIIYNNGEKWNRDITDLLILIITKHQNIQSSFIISTKPHTAHNKKVTKKKVIKTKKLIQSIIIIFNANTKLKQLRKSTNS